MNSSLKITLALALAFVVGYQAQAAQTTITKADTTTMNVAADWGGTAPGAGKIGQFDNTISSANATALTLGGNVTLDQLVFASTAPTVTIGNTTSATLTLGAASGSSGIDMSAANNDVTLNCAIKFNQSCTLTVPSSRTLRLSPSGGGGSLTQTASTTTTFDGSGTLSIGAANGASGLFTAGALFDMASTSGTVTSSAGRLWRCNVKIEGGSLGFTSGADRFSMATASQTFNMTGGSLTVPSTAGFGIRFACDNGAGGSTQVTPWTGTQSGGTITSSKGGSTFSLGGNANVSGSCSYTLSGTGILNCAGAGTDGTLILGADTTGNYTTTFNLQGGKLLVSGSSSGANAIYGAQAANAKQVFAWTGGTLVCGAYNAANLQSTAGGNYGTLNNGGGTLAPGDNGSSGKTTINGAYSVNSASSALNIDIGGTTASGAYQDAANSGKFDNVAVTGTAVLGGNLNVALINGTGGTTYNPSGSDTFKILTTQASGLSGSFNNVYCGRVTVASTSGHSLTVTYNTADVTLGSYAALSAGWTVQNASASAGTPVTFINNNSAGAITNWIVDFGDGSTKFTNNVSAGSTSTALNGVGTSHTYSGGNFTATLTVVASDGSTATTSQSITASSSVSTTTAVSLSAGNSSSTYGSPLTFKATVTPGSGSSVPTGTVQFYTDGVAYGSPVSVVADATSPKGKAEISAATLPYKASAYTVTATYTASGSFTGSSDSTGIQQTINKTPLTVTADNKSRDYGAANPSLTYTISGYVNSENATSAGLTGTATVSTTATATSPVAGSPYTITCAANNLSAANYSFSYVNGTLTISQAATFIGANSTNNPCGYKDAVAFTATLPTDATGSVVFSSTNGPINTNTLSSGSATSLAITNLPRGTNVIAIAYLGDGNYLGSSTNLEQIVTNHPPMANVMTVTRTAGLALMIALSDVATNWTDNPDGDHVSLAAVTLQSTNGVNLFALNWSTNLDGSIVTTNAYAYIGYTNSPNVNDQISYSISDGFGGTNIGFVDIVIQTSVTGTNSITAHDFTSPYSNTITAYGIPTFSYILQRATNLTSPVWVDVQTNQANATNGVIKAADTFWDLGGVKPSPSAFYQLKWQP